MSLKVKATSFASPWGATTFPGAGARPIFANRPDAMPRVTSTSTATRPLKNSPAHAGAGHARRPDLSRLGLAAPFLLIQSEKDTSTPLVGAQHILREFANARMLLVRGSDLHGVFNFTNSSCIERTAAHYLLTGDLPAPASRAFSCDDIFDRPVDALPGSHSSNAEPTAIDEPSDSTGHGEL